MPSIKTNPEQFERTIDGRRYVGIAWDPARYMAIATASLWTLLNWDNDPRPDLRVRKIPARGDRQEKFLILAPDMFDTTIDWESGERDMYLRIAREIDEYLGKRH